MKKLLLITILSIIHLNAFDTLHIKDSFKNATSANYLFYTKDIDNNLSAKDILTSKDLTLLSNSYLGMRVGVFWSKLNLKNDSKIIQNLVLYNHIGEINNINVFIFKNDKLIKSYHLGDLVEYDKKETINRYSLFYLTLLPNEEISIISRVENSFVYEIGWIIDTQNFFMEIESKKLIFWGLFGGIMFLFAIVSFVYFKVYKQKSYLILTLLALSVLTYHYGFQGILYKLNLGLNLQFLTALTWQTALLCFIFPLVFPYYFFNMQNSYKKIAFIIKLITFISITFFFMILYIQFINNDLFKFANLIIAPSILSIMLFLSIVSIYMIIKKELVSIYYFFAQTLISLVFFIYIMGLYRFLPFNDFIHYSMPIVSIIVILILIIATFIKTKERQKELYKSKEMLIEQSRFSSIGQSIGNITHQWKHPLAQIGSSITLLETIFHFDKKQLIQEFENQLPKINNSIELMQKTIEEFLSFYANKPLEKNFFLYNSIQNVLELLNSKIILKNANINIDIDKKETIFGYEHIFANIILVLIDNSLDEFKKENANNITISLNKTKNTHSILYQDNAGGIKIKPIESIFEYFVSSKEKANQGMGLAIVKMLVKDKLNGVISVENIENGALFKIKIPQNRVIQN